MVAKTPLGHMSMVAKTILGHMSMVAISLLGHMSMVAKALRGTCPWLQNHFLGHKSTLTALPRLDSFMDLSNGRAR